MSAQRLSKTLFGIRVSNICMASVLSRGGKIQTTKLTEHFGFDEFLEKHKQLVARLFAIDFKERVRIFYKEQRVNSQPEWSTIYRLTVEADKYRSANLNRSVNIMSYRFNQASIPTHGLSAAYFR